MKNKGIGGHQSAKSMKDEWLTPPSLIEKLGVFDLDPCSPVSRPWDTAKYHYTIKHDGLKRPWFGRVWCNPPYGKHYKDWLNKLADHGKGTALIFARTETTAFFESVWEKATAVLFIKGRITFHHVDGTMAKANSGAPSVLVAYGKLEALTLKECGIHGKFIDLKGEL